MTSPKSVCAGGWRGCRYQWRFVWDKGGGFGRGGGGKRSGALNKIRYDNFI